MTKIKGNEPEALSEVEEAQREFAELTGIDPAAHRAIEDEYDVDAGRARLEEALRKLGSGPKDD